MRIILGGIWKEAEKGRRKYRTRGRVTKGGGTKNMKTHCMDKQQHEQINTCDGRLEDVHVLDVGSK